MPKQLRLSALVATLIVLGACTNPTTGDGPSPTAATAVASLTPSASSAPASPGPSPAPSAAPTPPGTFVPLPTSTADCIPIDQTDLSAMEVTLGNVDTKGNGGEGIWPGRLSPVLDVTRVTEVTGQKRSMTPPPHARQAGRGLLVGGHEFVAFPSTWFDGHVNPEAMISARVALALDGQASQELPTRVIPGNENFDQIAVSVPDMAGSGSLTLDLVWADACYRYEVSSAIPVDVVPVSTTAGCALERDPYFDQIHALLDGSLRIGPALIHAFSPRNEAKFLSWGNPAIDAFMVYAFDREEPAIVAAPGTALTIEQVSSDLTIGKDMTLSVWTRASVARAVKDYPPVGTTLVLERTPVRQPDGTFRLRVPDAPGRYVAGVSLSYDSQCSSGTVWFVVNIDVVAPAPSASPAT